ncbi:Sir2 family NAD-dependent protein deacetylase [Chryseobacterium gambrini]|uniref:protein acetyllysine N-acetyltransferase n=1 Tax=Chryseobacterium gambrini TaxID=373672 RepID=A0AAJ1VPI3_9FLAO|nr:MULTISPECIES: Sir2 family NAD-dependent protein deacetylase [Chryseobacterium]MDN4015034.1 Sir2 family NAD-dependent protein deacetylase [Chryseobacterium gambrini]MDN4028604.1 Sir2 family NAD-dependent protein deacetylase [Chryseobacterium gambrini]QWA37821.1 iron dicitrate transport regulator FecR [Chryseobacterium sp. ZHDP1]
MKELKETLNTILKEKQGYITFLTGAGISAESGLPTYRSIDGIWIKGTKYHRPEEFGTYKYFSQNQEEVWQYNLFWKKMIAEAKPNPGHLAITEIEKLLGERFKLITQNVDGLHQRSGTQNVYEIHGSKQKVRCSKECSEPFDFPENIKFKEYTEDLTADDIDDLKCKKCGNWLRPHTLWFDESYNEKYYHFDTAYNIADHTDILFVVGTSGSTALPVNIVETVKIRAKWIVLINPESDTYFDYILKGSKTLFSVQESSSKALPELKMMIEDIINA